MPFSQANRFRQNKNRAWAAISNGSQGTSRTRFAPGYLPRPSSSSSKSTDSLNFMAKRYLGIEIGGTKLQIVVGDEASITARHRFEVDPAKGGAGIRHQIESALRPLIASAQPEAIGVGFGGPVDWKKGRICRSHQIEGWSDFELGDWLHRLSGRLVKV